MEKGSTDDFDIKSVKTIEKMKYVTKRKNLTQLNLTFKKRNEITMFASVLIVIVTMRPRIYRPRTFL